MRPILEYARNVWCSHYNKDIQSIEAVQRRAARFCMNCYSRYESVTNMLKWPTLTDRRNDLKLVMLYKIIHGYVNVQLTLPLTYSSLNSVTRGHHNKILQPPTRTDVYKYSFFPSAIRLWNNLPASLFTVKTINEFKNLLVNINK